MPTITDPNQLNLLREAVGDRSDVATLVAELNAPTANGSEVESVSAEVANGLLSFDTSAAIYDAGKSARTNPLPGRSAAIAWDRTLALGSVMLTEGTQGRAIVDALLAAGCIMDGEHEALVAAATRQLPGPSWAETNGLGQVYLENIAQALEATL